jgi:hypothetical protein
VFRLFLPLDTSVDPAAASATQVAPASIIDA